MLFLSPNRILFIAVLFVSSLLLQAQEPAGSTGLYEALKKQDSLLFSEGFNKCDIQQFENLVSVHFEFYHDEAGIISSKAAFITSIRDGICKLDYKPRRELDKRSLEVFPLKKDGKIYGAIQTGIHRFYAAEKGKTDLLTSTAKFTHLWLLENGSWKLARSLSYDHQVPQDSIDETRLFKDRDITDSWLQQKHIPAVGIGYIENGTIKEVTVYGHDEAGKPYTPDMIFNVASLTKPITAMVTLQLVNAGKWNLDEPVYECWTDHDISSDPRCKQLTTRHILSHRTGFPNWRYKNTDGKLAFEFDPGARYQYSGEGFEYLRKALEHKFKKPIDQLASELIFTPLGMRDTRFYWDKTMDSTRFAKWHKKDGTAYKTYKNSSPNAADDLLTTVADYSTFLLYVMNGAGLNKKLFKEMLSVQSVTKPRQHFGLGWLVDENVNGSEGAITHGGDDIGVHTIVFMLPQTQKALLIFTNCDHGTEVYIPAIKHYLGAAGEQIIAIETQ